WADERCVGPESSESNFRLAQENLFQPLQIASAQIHRIRGELPPPEAARKAGEELRRFFSRQDEPILDLIFLGMGEDGHVASLFPEEPEAMASDPGIFRAVTASKPPPNRVTLGYSMIFRAREVWVLVSGDAKQAALKTSLAENGKTPLARVIQARAHTKIFSDVAV
ncbi:MAG TPA: 6-phosphogluconolactonase, partial [Verrucomicrobiae bacterium]|nr:6-phosphogluconolactonase [Verrucomicrobiae bacterium]